jgi:methionyl-tRNA formyltransferase
MRFAIIGRGHLAVIAFDVLRKLGTVVKVVTNRIEPLWDARLRAHVGRLYPQVDLDTSGDWRQLLGTDADLVLSVMYDRIIGRELIDQTRVLNLHLGKLPEYRGMRPVNWALKNGESVAGVTLHEVDEGIDTGPIIAQTTFSIFPDVDEVKDVYGRSVRAAENILRDYLPIVDLLKATPQDESRAHYYSAADIARLGERTDWTR